MLGQRTQKYITTISSYDRTLRKWVLNWIWRLNSMCRGS